MKNIKCKIVVLSAFLTVGFVQPVMADVAVVVNPSNNAVIDEVSVRKIFLGKLKKFSNGNKTETYDLPESDSSRDTFREAVLKKSEARLNSHWARMLFSSKAKPPRVLGSADEIKAAVAENPNAIAYMDTADVDAAVKVVFTIK